jgi:tripartite-type tricarboxylate transporter receptor subunit TctC
MVVIRVMLTTTAIIAAMNPAAMAQSWPSKPIQIVVAGAAGSGPDITLRAYTDRLGKRLGQPVVVNNRPGASGTIAAQLVARAAADGYIFFLGTASQLIINKYVLKELNYDPDRDFEPVVLLNRAPFLILVNPKLPIGTLADLVKYDRANPGKLTLAYEGAAAQAAAGYLNRVVGLSAVLVPYNSPTQALMDTVSGRTDIHVQGSILAVPRMRDASLRALAATGAKRMSLFPDVPTMNETYSAFGSYEAWAMIVAPRGLPRPVAARIAGAVGEIAVLEDVLKLFAGTGVENAESYTPEASAAFLSQQNAQFAKMAAAAELKPQ